MQRTAKRQHHVFLQSAIRTPDGEGGYTTTWSDLTPSAIWVSIAPATAQTMERLFSPAIIAIATHVVEGPRHPQVTTQCRLIFGGRALNIGGVASPDEAGVEMVLACSEVVT